MVARGHRRPGHREEVVHDDRAALRGPHRRLHAPAAARATAAVTAPRWPKSNCSAASTTRTRRPSRPRRAQAEKPKKKTVGGRIREALGGGRKKSDDGGAKTKASKPARGAGKKVTTPRKAGGVLGEKRRDKLDVRRSKLEVSDQKRAQAPASGPSSFSRLFWPLTSHFSLVAIFLPSDRVRQQARGDGVRMRAVVVEEGLVVPVGEEVPRGAADEGRARWSAKLAARRPRAA